MQLPRHRSHGIWIQVPVWIDFCAFQPIDIWLSLATGTVNLLGWMIWLTPGGLGPCGTADATALHKTGPP
eukprot:scaffold65000_cov47-Prasinocladus_malaysianus.AAC.2